MEKNCLLSFAIKQQFVLKIMYRWKINISISSIQKLYSLTVLYRIRFASKNQFEKTTFTSNNQHQVSLSLALAFDVSSFDKLQRLHKQSLSQHTLTIQVVVVVGFCVCFYLPFRIVLSCCYFFFLFIVIAHLYMCYRISVFLHFHSKGICVQAFNSEYILFIFAKLIITI